MLILLSIKLEKNSFVLGQLYELICFRTGLKEQVRGVFKSRPVSCMALISEGNMQFDV